MFLAALVEVNTTVLLLAPKLPNWISSVVALELVDDGWTPFVQLVGDVQFVPVLFHKKTTAWALLAIVNSAVVSIVVISFFIN